jgi:hypothetical protein
MVSSSISTIKATDGEDIIVFTRPRTKPDSIIEGNSPNQLAHYFWLCDGYGDSPFVYYCFGAYLANVVTLSEHPGIINVISLTDHGSIKRISTAPYNKSSVHQEASRLLTDEIIRRTLLV